MLSTLALVGLFALSPATVRSPVHSGAALPATARASMARQARLPVPSFRLRSAWLDGGSVSTDADARLAQRRRPTTSTATATSSTTAATTPTPPGTAAATTPPAGAATAPATTPPATTPPATTPAAGDPTPATGAPATTGTTPDAPPATTPETPAAAPTPDAAQPASEEEPDIELLRHRAAITRVHRPLGIATWASFLVTLSLGTLRVINARSAFGAGLCARPSPDTGMGILGEFGCSGLTPLHGFSSFITTALYTTTAILAASMPDPERASEGNDRRATILRLHRAVRWVHLTGMILMPILGILAARPDVIGISPSAMDDFSMGMRTVHMFVGYTTFAALTTAMILELM